MSLPDESGQIAASTKCANCSRKAKQGCTHSLCLKCCEDSNCRVHQEQRDQAAWRELILTGQTPQQLALEDKLSKRIQPGRFREPGFSFMGDTVIIWYLRDYLTRNPKWKEDALRKASKRNARQRQDAASTAHPFPRMRGPANRRRFHDIMERLYQESISKSN